MKKIAILSLILSSYLYANSDIEGRVKVGVSASFGIEGLDLNISKLDMYKFLTSKEIIKEKEENKLSNVDKYILGKSKLDDKAKPKKVGGFDIKDIALHGVKLDSTLFDGELNIKKLKTKI